MATIKDLIGLGPDELEKLSDEELRIRCEPYLRVAVLQAKEDDKDPVVQLDEVSPEDIAQRQKEKKQRTARKAVDLLAEMQKLAALHGVDINLPTKIK